jgi:hypothetical protein
MMGKLVETTHVTLGGEVGSNDWAFPYLDEQHVRYNKQLLTEAGALLLGRHTYEHLSIAYTRMADEAPAGTPRRSTATSPHSSTISSATPGGIS